MRTLRFSILFDLSLNAVSAACHAVIPATHLSVHRPPFLVGSLLVDGPSSSARFNTKVSFMDLSAKAVKSVMIKCVHWFGARPAPFRNSHPLLAPDQPDSSSFDKHWASTAINFIFCIWLFSLSPETCFSICKKLWDGTVV